MRPTSCSEEPGSSWPAPIVLGAGWGGRLCGSSSDRSVRFRYNVVRAEVLLATDQLARVQRSCPTGCIAKVCGRMASLQGLTACSPGPGVVRIEFSDTANPHDWPRFWYPLRNHRSHSQVTDWSTGMPKDNAPPPRRSPTSLPPSRCPVLVCVVFHCVPQARSRIRLGTPSRRSAPRLVHDSGCVSPARGVRSGPTLRQGEQVICAEQVTQPRRCRQVQQSDRPADRRYCGG